MTRAIRNVMLLVIVLAVGASAQDAGTSKPIPCPTASTSAPKTATRAPDLSEAAKKACDSKKGDYWDEQKGCMWIVQLDGDGSNVLRIDTQSSAVQKNTADYEYERLPIERSIGGILSLP